MTSIHIQAYMMLGMWHAAALHLTVEMGVGEECVA